MMTSLGDELLHVELLILHLHHHLHLLHLLPLPLPPPVLLQNLVMLLVADKNLLKMNSMLDFTTN